MTVQELIQQLQNFPQDVLVVTEGYEDGFDTIKKISIIRVEENPKKEWYVGKFIDSESPDAKEAVLLFADTKAEDK
jgi:hypothetical protein